MAFIPKAPKDCAESKKKADADRSGTGFRECLAVSGGDWGNHWLRHFAALQEDVTADTTEEEQRGGDLTGLWNSG